MAVKYFLLKNVDKAVGCVDKYGQEVIRRLRWHSCRLVPTRVELKYCAESKANVSRETFALELAC